MGKYPQSAFLKWECGPTENTAYLSIDLGNCETRDARSQT